MKMKELFEKLQGIQTIELVMKTLNVNKQKAIYYIHRLRKKGCVETHRGADGIRIYRIRPIQRIGGEDYYTIINKTAPEPVMPLKKYRVHGRKITTEEALIFAVKTKSIRTIIAAMSLFRKIKNWKELRRLAKENSLEREIAALYEVARKEIKKVRKMPKSFAKNKLPKKQEPYKYIVEGISSDSYKEIEEKWKVYLPLNRADLAAYRGVYT